MLEYVLYGALIGGCIGLVVAIIMIPIMKSRAKAIPRFSQPVSYSGDISLMMTRIVEFLAKEGYSPNTFKNEEVYQKGIGALVAKQFIKVLPQSEGFLVEGFISLYGSETGLSGALGVIPKKACKKVIDKLIDFIKNDQTPPAGNSNTDESQIKDLSSENSSVNLEG